jgi:hypothetical protein
VTTPPSAGFSTTYWSQNGVPTSPLFRNCVTKAKVEVAGRIRIATTEAPMFSSLGGKS